MKVLKRCSVEMGKGYGVLIYTMVLGMSGLCFVGSGVTQEALFERSHTERRNAETLGLRCVGGGSRQVQEKIKKVKISKCLKIHFSCSLMSSTLLDVL